MGTYEILKRVGSVSYELKLPIELTPVHLMFHVSMLKERIGDSVSILPLEGIKIDANISYEEVKVEIVAREVN